MNVRKVNIYSSSRVLFPKINVNFTNLILNENLISYISFEQFKNRVLYMPNKNHDNNLQKEKIVIIGKS
jgi:hypothetical protein